MCKRSSNSVARMPSAWSKSGCDNSRFDYSNGICIIKGSTMKRSTDMGYTNYWNQFRDFTDEEWVKIKDQCKYVHEVMPQIIVTHNNADGGRYISINGVGEKGHETLYLAQEAGHCAKRPSTLQIQFL